MQQTNYISLLILGMLFISSLQAQEIQISASVDRNPVAENEQFVYQVEISGASQNLPDVQLPDFSDFHVVGGPSTSSSVQIINFKISASRTHSVVLVPRKTGAFEIGPARTSYKDKDYASNTISLTVQQSTGSPSPSGSEPQTGAGDVDISQLVFLKVIPSKTTAYVNEEMTLQYKIYFRVNISNNEMAKFPEALGCWVEEYPVPRRPSVYSETIQGVRYNVAEIRKVAVFPSRSGKITISPMEMIVDAVIPRKQQRRSRSLFDDFFSDPFSQVVKKKISSGSLELNVLPLPDQGKPANFGGLVGDFTIQTSMDKKAVLTNEAISYKIKIAGSGLLKYLNTLPLEFSPDFEVFEPKVNESVNKQGSQLSSSKEFE
ncbi:MAG: protein BatD, partial [bacterium]